MGIPVTYFQYDDLAYDSGDISFGEAENKDILINDGTQINKVAITKFSVTFTARGCTGADLAALEAKRENTVKAMLRGNANTETINVLGKTIENAVLTKVTPSAPITVDGITVFESIATEYQSQVWA